MVSLPNGEFLYSYFISNGRVTEEHNSGNDDEIRELIAAGFCGGQWSVASHSDLIVFPMSSKYLTEHGFFPRLTSLSAQASAQCIDLLCRDGNLHKQTFERLPSRILPFIFCGAFFFNDIQLMSQLIENWPLLEFNLMDILSHCPELCWKFNFDLLNALEAVANYLEPEKNRKCTNFDFTLSSFSWYNLSSSDAPSFAVILNRLKSTRMSESVTIALDWFSITHPVLRQIIMEIINDGSCKIHLMFTGTQLHFNGSRLERNQNLLCDALIDDLVDENKISLHSVRAVLYSNEDPDVSEDASRLAKFSCAIRELTLKYPFRSDRTARDFSGYFPHDVRFPELEHLNLCHCQIHEELLVRLLCCCPKLEALGLGLKFSANPLITLAASEIVRNIKNLHVVDISGPQIIQMLLIDFSVFSELQKLILDVEVNDFSDFHNVCRLLESLADCQKLQFLEIRPLFHFRLMSHHLLDLCDYARGCQSLVMLGICISSSTTCNSANRGTSGSLSRPGVIVDLFSSDIRPFDIRLELLYDLSEWTYY